MKKQQTMNDQTQTIESPETHTKETKNSTFNVGWYIFIALMFGGIGVGKIVGNTGAGTMIGMALGFVGLVIYMIATKKHK